MRHAWISASLFAAVLLPWAGLSGASPANASGAPTDLPGVPLRGGEVTDTVGGPTVDRVYSIEVPAASVLVVSVSGAVGAELGLYVFDQGAASIAEGFPVAESAKPGATQTVTLQFLSGSVVYIDINGRNTDREYSFLLTATVLTDTTPPLIEELRPPMSAPSANVCLYLRAKDPISLVKRVRVAEAADPTAGEWQQYSGAGNYCTAVSLGDGVRLMQVDVENGIGLLRSRNNVAVTIDDRPPAYKGFSPANGVLPSPSSVLQWTFDEPVVVAGDNGAGVITNGSNGVRIDGRFSFVGEHKVLRWTPTTRLPLGTVLVANLSPMKDYAGNAAKFVSLNIVSRKNRTSLSLVKVTSLASGAFRLTIDSASTLLGKRIAIQVLSSDEWTIVRSVRVTASRMHIRITGGRLARGSIMRCYWAGNDQLTPAVSKQVGL